MPAQAKAGQGISEKGKARIAPASVQKSLPGRYSLAVRLLAMAALAWAFLGWLNESYLFMFQNPVWMNRYTEYAIILALGIWRIRAERNPYTRKRFMVLITVVTLFWWLIPWLAPFHEPYIGALPHQPVFPSLHTPGTITFIATLGLVWLFGRRVICGWACPCVGIRETAGFAYREKTLRGPLAWKLRHTKWLFFALYMMAAVIIFRYSLDSWGATFLGLFSLLVAIPYFMTFFLMPVTGNRFYCRFLCPYGATFGLLNKAGFFKIGYEKQTCTDCGLCEKVCDMGIPVVTIGKQEGKVDTADCMGCGRCVTECPSGSLEFHDVRNVLLPALRQDGAALKQAASPADPAYIRHVAIFAVLAILVTATAGWFHMSVGGPGELSTDLMGLLCGH